MQRALSIHNLENLLNQLRAFEVGELPERGFTAKVSRIKRIAARAPEWTFSGDLNRKGWFATGENSRPCLKDLTCFHRTSKLSIRCYFPIHWFDQSA
jgi:hypothetical protein